MPVDVNDNSIRIRQSNPSNFQKGSFRTITIDKSKGIKAVIGKPKGKDTTKIQTVIFPKKSFTVAQAKKWLKDHDMKTEEILQEAVWTTKYVNDLDDSSFLYIAPGGEKDDDGKTKPRSLRYFPYKDAAGKVDLPHLRNALARIPQSKLPADVKKRIAAKARSIAKNQGIDTSEEFLDPVNLRFPISQSYLTETLIRFNSGEPLFFDYTAEQMDYMGRKLARELNKGRSEWENEWRYDEHGELVGTSFASQDSGETQYEYQDGQIVVMKRKSDGSSETTWERSDDSGGDMMDMEEEIENDDAAEAVAESDHENIFEAYSTGDMIKAMRTKKKMSRTDMAAKMNMSKDRLTEIEDDVDEPDEDEIGEIAKALGMTLKRMQKMMDAMTGNDEEEDSAASESVEVYEVISAVAEEDGVYDIVEIAENVVDSAKEENKNIFTKESIESRMFRGVIEDCHKFYGNFISESIQRNKDGSITFRVPIFKFGELTSNGNRYMEECGENLKKHLSRINKKNSKLEAIDEAKKTPIDIEVANYLDGRSLDMLATHRGRVGEGNPLLERAGRIIGGEIGQIEGDKAFFLIGETLSKYPGDAITEQIMKGMIRGVSLFGIPTKFEENTNGGSDVYDMQLVGADFTDDGGNLIQFKDKKNASFAVLN